VQIFSQNLAQCHGVVFVWIGTWHRRVPQILCAALVGYKCLLDSRTLLAHWLTDDRSQVPRASVIHAGDRSTRLLDRTQHEPPTTIERPRDHASHRSNESSTPPPF